MHAEQAQTIVDVAKAENERDGRQRQEELTQATKLVQQHASQVWQWLQTANKEAEDHRNNLQKLHREVEERVTRYEEKVQQRGASGSPSPGTVDTQSSHCATQQDLETVQAHLSNKILQVKQDMLQYQETNQRAVDDAKGKQRHHDFDVKTAVEQVQTALNQKIQDMENSVEMHHRKMNKEWQDTQEKLRHYESELLTTREKKIQEREHTKHATPDDAGRRIQSIKDELEQTNEVLERLKDQLETSSTENAGEIQALTEEIERVKNNHREALERHKRGVKDQLENSTGVAKEKYQQVQDHCMTEIRKVMDDTARFKEEVAEMVAKGADSVPPKVTASVEGVIRRPAEDTESVATLFTVDASRTVASEAVRLRIGPSWMPSVKSELLSWYNERYDDTTTFRWRQIEWLFTEDHFLVPGRALKPPPSRKGRSVRPTGIWECAAFLEVRPERQYGTETHELDPSKRDEPGVFGKEGHTWIDDETKDSMQQEAKVPHWDCTVETKDKWSKQFLKWRHRRRGRFSPAYQVELLISVLDNKNFREAKEQQLEDEGVEDDFELAWNIVTGTVLPHEYKGKAEFRDLQIDVSQDMTSERWVTFWAEFQQKGAKVKGGMTHQSAKEALLQHFYYYRAKRPQDKLWERMERRLHEDEAAYAPYSYVEMFAWICGQLVNRDQAQESRRQILGAVKSDQTQVVRELNRDVTRRRSSEDKYKNRSTNRDNRDYHRSRDNRHGKDDKRHSSADKSRKEFRRSSDSRSRDRYQEDRHRSSRDRYQDRQGDRDPREPRRRDDRRYSTASDGSAKTQSSWSSGKTSTTASRTTRGNSPHGSERSMRTEDHKCFGCGKYGHHRKDCPGDRKDRDSKKRSDSKKNERDKKYRKGSDSKRRQTGRLRQVEAEEETAREEVTETTPPAVQNP